MRKAKTDGIRYGSENVFADLGLPDAGNHLVKAKLVSRIMDVMQAKRLTQTSVAERAGMRQPDVSNLIRGRFRGYSIDRLMGILVALDQDVEIVVRTRPRNRAGARLTVSAS